VTINATQLTGVVRELGTLNDYSGLVSMATNSNQIMIVNGSTRGWVYSPLNFRAVEIGDIGGSGSDTYNLTINNVDIYTEEDVSTALSAVNLIDQINTLTDDTGVTAESGGTGIINLTSSTDADIVIVESGTGFTAGTDGFTVSTGPFSTGAATAFVEISDSNFTGGSAVAFLDGYFFISKPDTNIFYASQINDGLTYNALDFATAEINSNPITAMAVKNRQLWIFKKDYVEVWYDAANATGMPLAPRVGSELSIGCIVRDSLVSIDNTLYWLDNRHFVSAAITTQGITNQTTGNTAVPMSTDPLNSAFENYDLSEVVATGFQEGGHLMYQITFPREKKTWVYDLTAQMWHERSYRNSSYSTTSADLAEIAVSVYGYTIVAGRQNANIYVSNSQYTDDAGQSITMLEQHSRYKKILN